MWDAAVFVGIVLSLGGIVLFSDEPVTPGLIALAALTFVYVGASVFDDVREHPVYNLAAAVCTVLLFGGIYLIESYQGVIFLALTVLSVFGVVVETYNYRYGTSYLRIDT
ncbi:phosphatidate cytidylyltransferase (plasmid) [Haloferax mediterranei ATCC 33500]|nr:hypothetical protein C439_00475 [Haloferax mediterranei ATCC 33500]QCQ77357.1 phosphatidate cytidylyltransferase [Haloferax mediterranei ATCC 33500]